MDKDPQQVWVSDNYKIYARVNIKDIAFLTKIIEAYENLALVTTVDIGEGVVVLHVTPDTRETVLGILSNLPIPVTLL